MQILAFKMKKFIFVLITFIIFLSAFPITACAAENAENAGGASNHETTDNAEKKFADEEEPVSNDNATDAAAFNYEENDGKITVTGLADETLTEDALYKISGPADLLFAYSGEGCAVVDGVAKRTGFKVIFY